MEPELNDYPELTMAEITNKLFKRNFLSDVKFQVDGKLIYAHSFMLMLRSTVFQNQLTGTMNEQKLIPIDYASYDSVYQFVRFIYSDECAITENNEVDLFKLAKHYKIISLENKVFSSVCFLFNDHLNLFDQCLLKSDQTFIYDLTARGCLEKYLTTEQFLVLPSDTIETILRSEYTNISELELFQALMRWIQKNSKDTQIEISQQKFHYGKLLSLIRFPVMTNEEISKCLAIYPQLFTDSELASLFKIIIKAADGENHLWNIKQRKQFKLEDRNESFPKHEKFETKFLVSREMILIGLWYAQVTSTNVKIDIKQSHCSSNQKNFSIISKGSRQSYTRVINLGESIRLQPNCKYTIEFDYFQTDGKININRFLKPDDLFSNISTDFINLEKVGKNLLGMFFKLPAD